MDDLAMKIKSYQNALLNGDENIVKYNYDSPLNTPILSYQRLIEPCQALVALWKTPQSELYQAYITGESFKNNAARKITAISCIKGTFNRCDILLEIENEIPVAFPTEAPDSFFFMYAKSDNHSHLCMYDSSLKDHQAFSMISKDEYVGIYLANIASMYIAPYMEGAPLQMAR